MALTPFATGFNLSSSIFVTSSGVIAAKRLLYGTNLVTRNLIRPVKTATATSNQPTPLKTSAARSHGSVLAGAQMMTEMVAVGGCMHTGVI